MSRNPEFTLKGMKVRTNWLNGLLGVLLVIAGPWAMNFRDWHTGVFTGWSWFGVVILAIGAVLFGGLVVLWFTSHKRWPVIVAFILGVGLGVGAVFFFQDAHIQWKGALAGLLLFVVIGGLLSGITFTTWSPNRKAKPVAVPVAAPTAASAATPLHVERGLGSTAEEGVSRP